MKRYARHFKLLTIIFTLVFALSITDLAKADELYGRVRGTVTDASGAVLPDATVKISNTATGFTKEVTSGKDGGYELINLPPGVYSLTATKSGFTTYQLAKIPLMANQVYAAPVSLQIGAVSTEILVQANAAQVEQSSMQLTATIDSRTITSLPLNGRNWISLQQTLPGVVLADTRFGNNFSTNGSQAQQNSFLINGSDYNDLPLNSPLAAPSPDAIGEVRMVTNTINPEYGRNSGAILNATTRTGTNSLHGDAFEFYRDTFLNTKNYFQKTPSVFHQNQYGGTIGGPIWKNKTFAFFSLQNTRNRTSQTIPGGLPTVFTQAQLNGDFSGLASKLSATKTNPFPIQGSSGAIFPAGTPWNVIFPTGQIPVADFNPTSVALVKQFVPQPNFGTNQFSFQPISGNATNQYLGRLDQNIGSKDSLWFYGFAQNSTTANTLPFTGATLPGFGDQSVALTKQFTTAWNHTINTNMLNELRVAYTRLNFASTTPQNVVQPSTIGFPNIFPQFTTGAGAPFIGITGFFNLGFSTNGPQPRKDQTYQITDNFSWVRGKHSFKMGYEGRKFEVWNPFEARNNGSFSFSTSGKFSTGVTGINFLLGIPASYDQTAGGLIVADAYEHYAYFQDQWRVRDNLTLTYGVGYQIDTPLAEHQFGGISRGCFNPGVQSAIFPTAPLGLVYPGDPGCNASGGATTKYNHFGPRLGFAYSPDYGRMTGGAGKTSIRGGFGVYFNRSEEELSLQDLGIPPNGLDSAGIGDVAGKKPSFPNPFTDISGTGSIPNKFPFSPPAPGTPFNYAPFLPLSISTLDPNATVPYAMNFNLTVERELPSQTIVRVGYVGALGRKLIVSLDRNPTTQAGVAACLTDPNCFNSPGNQEINFPSHFQFPGSQFASVGTQSNKGTSNYHALQLTVDKHTTHGLQMLGTYTWSHALDVSSSFEDTAFVGAGSFDPYGRLARDYGNAAFDTRHRFTVSFAYDIPNLNKLSMFSRVPSRIFGGWGLAGINIMQTGQPIVLSDFNENSLTCNDKTFYSCPDRPDLVSTPVALDPRAPTSMFGGQNTFFFNPASFADNAIGTLGTSGRNFFHGPGFWNTDFAVTKNTAITERTAIQLRLEAFNLFNHTNFKNPISEFTDANFGRITAIRTGTNSRLVQLGAKFIF